MKKKKRNDSKYMDRSVYYYIYLSKKQKLNIYYVKAFLSAKNYNDNRMGFKYWIF